MAHALEVPPGLDGSGNRKGHARSLERYDVQEALYQ